MYLANKLGYSLIKESESYFGKLRLSQMKSLFSGMSEFKKKESESLSKNNKLGGRHEAHTLKEVSKIPGVSVARRKR